MQYLKELRDELSAEKVKRRRKLRADGLKTEGRKELYLRRIKKRFRKI
jgi:hypothetical protein